MSNRITCALALLLLVIFVSAGYAAGASPEAPGTLDTKWLVSLLVAACLGALQALCLFILVGLRSDIGDLWKRANNHGHEIDCGGSGCRPKTVSVTVHD